MDIITLARNILFLGLLREQEGVAAQVLLNLGVKLEDVREEVIGLLGAEAVQGGINQEKEEKKGEIEDSCVGRFRSRPYAARQGT